MLLLTLQEAEDFTALPHILLNCNMSQATPELRISPKYRNYLCSNYAQAKQNNNLNQSILHFNILHYPCFLPLK